MSGGSRLLLLVLFSSLFIVAVFADDTSVAPSTPAGPPAAEKKPVEEVLHGRTIPDAYRWLEDSKSPDTQKWVGEEPLPLRKSYDTNSDFMHVTKERRLNFEYDWKRRLVNPDLRVVLLDAGDNQRHAEHQPQHGPDLCAPHL